MVHHLIQTSMYDTYSGLLKITAHLDHVRHCKQHLVLDIVEGARVRGFGLVQAWSALG